ncbi:MULTISPECIES: RNA ligase [Methanobacterium]|jgi:putative ATP-dependent DNA ligase|uniref:RNA ligase n=1 Tax=Methanobacterium subterraneum TaxID=59277 RepID=A0A2H4VR83_9EURY|nr:MULTISPECIES: RNA ligase [Methanobacterium]AUB57494.1 RNA ligase [Methanobacterium sp. MZ-A1]AUB60615.1 RNA ligase [Methanobacterium subterraneum]MBW4258409.1 RNA ligase [Methanobacterium sp. YSL]NMO08371.1 RNA ligase [Methanobacterium subterraneum]
MREKNTPPLVTDEEVSHLLDIPSPRLEDAYRKGIIKKYQKHDLDAIQFRKGLGRMEAGTMVIKGEDMEVIRGFPKIRRTLMLHPALEKHFPREVAVEEKMNGYNVRIAQVNGRIVAFTRGGYICPYTSRKATQILDLDEFFQNYPEMVICGEMVGTLNPYVSHYYPEVGKLGFRIFDLREKLTNKPLPVLDKRELLADYHLEPVRLLGIFPVKEAPENIMEITNELGKNDREGVVMKDPQMELEPLKYTSSQAQAAELEYALSFPFDLAQAFLFSRIIREGFQAHEAGETGEKLRERALRMGESALYPMLQTISKVEQGELAAEDLLIEVDNLEEAEEFIRHLRDLKVMATLVEVKNGKAVIRRIHQSTNDRINNYLDGGLY